MQELMKGSFMAARCIANQEPLAKFGIMPNADVQRCIVYRGHAAQSDVQLLKILAQQITLSMQRHTLKVISSCAPCGCRNSDP
jgi:hypothetical protein